MATLNREQYRRMTTNDLRSRHERATERLKRAPDVSAAIDDLFTIDEIDAVLSERNIAAALAQVA